MIDRAAPVAGADPSAFVEGRGEPGASILNTPAMPGMAAGEIGLRARM
ncbi:hypothetical protein [Sphingomonas spermidinifaciens]|nr:hypothetical protein [Sphingomonas spermidinifaciens]